jgi:acyl-coenzyme A thioesterase PaaI-like protein
MFRTAAFKSRQRAALAATAFTLASSTAFAVIPHIQHRCAPSKQATKWPVGSWSAVSGLASRVQCQALNSETAWEVEESDSYHYQKIDLPSRAIETSHIIFGQLLKEGCIERYTVYKRINKIGEESPELIVSDIHLGNNLDGHEGVVHGGILAMLFDDSMGMAFGAMGIKMAYTANLNVDYRVPVLANSRVLIRVRLSKQEGRKLYFSAQMTSLDASILYAESTTLYVIPKQ